MKTIKMVMIAALLVCAAVFLCGCTTTPGETTPATTPATTAPAAISGVVTIFNAGSLTAPFEDLEKQFEAKYPGTDVQLVAGGSTKIVKDIVELDKSADVLASADYTLIPDLMMPDDADWYVTFAKNQMVLCYTDDSKYAGEVNADNWYEILGRSDVAWAFSDPNLDPCGYRSPMVIQLAEAHYGDDQIFEKVVMANSNISVTEDNGVFTIHAKSPEPKGTLQIRPKSVELVQMLESGGIDYAWEYRSVAAQNNLKFIELPEAIDLSSVTYADDYATVQIDTEGGMMTADPIVYGATVPKNAGNPDAGLAFVKLLIGAEGQAVMDGQGQPPVVPAGGFGNVPAALKSLTASS
ncbi:MAG TPA: tungstate ABC transporter substrate-binding protein WtpA [Methanofollis liminatans]|uniref:Tungstate ABC transporter substrate-binding protein WtpA n=1 Tax=Methanofollis liminatans TaxID=2201 RepID=A0A831LV51_9EURY|nr:tungstate ABC transporter substrate-binding protein WtpA [Methanofollis liminatans]